MPKWEDAPEVKRYEQAPAIGGDVPEPIRPTREMMLQDPEYRQGLEGTMFGRETFIGAGGALGAAAGMLGGPAAPATIAAGGALGVMGGNYAFDLADNIARGLQGYPIKEADLVEATKRAGTEGAIDLAFSSVAGPVGHGIYLMGRPLAGKLFGTLNPESKRLVDLGETLGVDLGVIHASPRGWVKNMQNTLGVFPFVSTPLIRGQRKVVTQLDEASADLLNTLAPISTKYDISKDLTERAANRFKKADRIAGKLYERFADVADNLSVQEIVPTTQVKDALAEIAERQAKEAVELADGGQFERFGPDAIGEWLKQLEEFPERISVSQARGLERELNALFKRGKLEGWDTSRLTQVKSALDSAKNNMDVSQLQPDEAERVLGAWTKANQFWGWMEDTFNSSTAKRFGRANVNIFKRRWDKAGSITQDQIYEAVFQAKSPEALQELKTLVGPGTFKKASRRFIEDQYQRSILPAKEGDVLPSLFSTADFKKRLGLDTPEGWDVVDEMLKGTDVSAKDWRQFLEVAESATDIKIRNPSTFVMRRFILGAGLAGSVFMGGGQISLPASALLTWAARNRAKFLMNKDSLKLMTRVMEPTTSDAARRQAVTRLLRLGVLPGSEEIYSEIQKGTQKTLSTLNTLPSAGQPLDTLIPNAP